MHTSSETLRDISLTLNIRQTIELFMFGQLCIVCLLFCMKLRFLTYYCAHTHKRVHIFNKLSLRIFVYRLLYTCIFDSLSIYLSISTILIDIYIRFVLCICIQNLVHIPFTLSYFNVFVSSIYSMLYLYVCTRLVHDVRWVCVYQYAFLYSFRIKFIYRCR